MSNFSFLLCRPLPFFLIICLFHECLCSNVTVVYTVAPAQSLLLECPVLSEHGSRWIHNNKSLYLSTVAVSEDFEEQISLFKNYSLFIKNVVIDIAGTFDCISQTDVIASYNVDVEGEYLNSVIWAERVCLAKISLNLDILFNVIYHTFFRKYIVWIIWEFHFLRTACKWTHKIVKLKTSCCMCCLRKIQSSQTERKSTKDDMRYNRVYWCSIVLWKDIYSAHSSWSMLCYFLVITEYSFQWTKLCNICYPNFYSLTLFECYSFYTRFWWCLSHWSYGFNYYYYNAT